MTLQEAEEYFKDKNVAHEIYADKWTENTIDAVAAVTDAFHSGKTLRDMSDVIKAIDYYIAQITKAPLTEKTKGARDAFLVTKKLITDGVPTK